VIAACQGHALDQKLPVAPSDVHRDGIVAAQAERPLPALIGLLECRLKLRRAFIEGPLPNPELPHGVDAPSFNRIKAGSISPLSMTINPRAEHRVASTPNFKRGSDGTALERRRELCGPVSTASGAPREISGRIRQTGPGPTPPDLRLREACAQSLRPVDDPALRAGGTQLRSPPDGGMKEGLSCCSRAPG